MEQRMSHRVLIIEDDRDIAHLVQMHLQDQEYEADVAYDGVRGLQRALLEPYDLVILDLTLPGIKGLDICRRLRAAPECYPLLLMLTSRSSEPDRVLGLDLGADDYMTKPFSIRELIARVKALFRRAESLRLPSCPSERPEGDAMIIRSGNLAVDQVKHQVMIGDTAISLTAKEFDLLVQFACHPGRVYTRSDLLELVWGNSYEGYEHTVNSHINRLRTKIEIDPARPRFLLTVWGVGYKFAEAEDVTAAQHDTKPYSWGDEVKKDEGKAE